MRLLIRALSRLFARGMVLFLLGGCFSALVVFFTSPAGFLQARKAYNRWQGDFSEKQVWVGKHKLSYLENSLKSSPTIIMLHSFGSEKDNFVPFARYFSSQYHVVIVDLPGFGSSSKIQGGDYRVPAQRQRIIDFLDTTGIEKAHFVGNSFGALISAAVFLLEPERVLSLGLFAPPGAASAKPSETMVIKRKTGRNAFAPTNEAEYRQMLKLLFFHPPWVPDHFVTYLTNASINKRPFLDYMIKQLKKDQTSFEPLMKDVKTPTLILWGENDTVLHVSGAEIFHQGIANSEKIIVKQCGHACHVEKTSMMAKHYGRFLNRVENSLQLTRATTP